MIELLFGALVAGSAIKCGAQNIKAMSKPYRYLKDGTPVYLDRTAQEHINGEVVKWLYDYKTGDTQLKGMSSGRVYESRKKNIQDRLNKWEEEDKQRAREFGNLAYVKVYPKGTLDSFWDVRLTCELSTGKIISRLEGRKDGTYWKYYLTDLTKFNSGDRKYESEGVQITEEEYKKLNISCGSHFAFDSNHEYYDAKGRRRWRA